MRQSLVFAFFLMAGSASAQLLDSGSYRDASPNGAQGIRTVEGHAVMRGIRFSGTLRKFYPTQIQREFNMWPDQTIVFSDHRLDTNGNVYANGTLFESGFPARQFVVKCDAALNIVWTRILPATFPRNGAQIAVTPDGAKILAAYYSSDRTQTGYLEMAADGSSIGYYRHARRTGRATANPIHLEMSGDKAIFATDEGTFSESYPNFTVVNSARRWIRRAEIRPTTGRGADGRGANWRIDDVKAGDFSATGRIYFTARDEMATGAETVSRLTALSSDDSGSRPTFVQSWAQKDTVAFRGPRRITRLAYAGGAGNVAWMGRYDRAGGTTPIYRPFFVNAYRPVDGSRDWFKVLAAAPDDATANRDSAMGDLAFDRDGYLRAYAVEVMPGSVYGVRTYTLRPSDGDTRTERLLPGFYFRPPYDVRGSIGTVAPNEVALGLSDGWALATLMGS